jgi:hypothetical protein
MLLLQCTSILSLSQYSRRHESKSMTDGMQAQDDFEPIAPTIARERILQALNERLGDDWRDEDTGWLVLHEADYYMRLSRAGRYLDAQCDLLGNVTLEEHASDGTQSTGRMLAWLVLGASLLLAYMLAWLAGFLS